VIDLQAVTCCMGSLQFSFELQLPAGQCTAVMGASGSGKSTLLNLLAGFVPISRGRLMLDGRDATHLAPAQRPVTSLFQEHNLFSHLSVFDNVGLGLHPGLRLNESQRQQVNEALVQVGLEGFGKRLPAALSGGERQRVALARSLVRHQPILLLDEPFSALDPARRQDMLHLVDQLRQSMKLTVMLVTHEPRDAESIAQQAVFLHQYQVCLQGPVAQVLTSQEANLMHYLAQPPASTSHHGILQDPID
jgi:thiamine transport system ATP-binding protein